MNQCNYLDFDWNRIWRTHHAHKILHERRSPKHWDGRAKEFTKAVARGDYVQQFLDICEVGAEESVLDVGAAAGSLAVPLASRVARITALEPSSVMRELLHQRCVAGNIHNIRSVDGRWEDDWDTLGIAQHDVIIVSRSLVTPDLGQAIAKVERYARRRIYISTLVDDGPFDRKLVAATGRTFTPGVDYIVVLNYLRQIGIYANLRFTTHRDAPVFADLDEAVSGMSWMVQGMTDQECTRLRAYLDATLIRDNGMLRRPVHLVRWAVLWWDVEGTCAS